VAYRAQLFFGDSGVGWSETYWNNAANSVPDLLQRAIALAKVRYGMLANDSNTPDSEPGIRYIRAEETVQRIIQVATADDLRVSVKDKLATPPEVPWSTVLLRYEFTIGAFIYHAMRMMSGIPDLNIIDPPGPALAPADPEAAKWFKRFQAWQSYLTDANNGWALPHAVYTAAPIITINNASRNADGSLTLVTNVPISAQSPATVYLRGFTPRQWNGRVTFEVNPITSTVWTSSQKFFKPPSTSIVVGGIYTLSQQLGPITAVKIRGETHRSRGRVFGQPRGRRVVRAGSR